MTRKPLKTFKRIPRPRRSTANYSPSIHFEGRLRVVRRYNGVGSNKNLIYSTGSRFKAGKFFLERHQQQLFVRKQVGIETNHPATIADFAHRSRQTYVRKPMTSQTTKSMLDYAATHENKRTGHYHRLITNPEDGLSGNHISRNHILADSAVADIVHHSFYQVRTGKVGAAGVDHVRHFFAALAGDHDDVGVAESYQHAVSEFKRAIVSKSESTMRRSLHESISTISNSMGNLRFGDAGINTAVGGAYDPNVYATSGAHGTLKYEQTQRSKTIMSATQNLLDHKVIDKDLFDRVTTPVINRHTGEWAPSSLVYR